MSADDSYAPKSPDLSSFSSDESPQPSSAQSERKGSGQPQPGLHYQQQVQHQQHQHQHQHQHQQQHAFPQHPLQQPSQQYLPPHTPPTTAAGSYSYFPPSHSQPFRQYPQSVAQGGVQAPGPGQTFPPPIQNQHQHQPQPQSQLQQAPVAYGLQSPPTYPYQQNHHQQPYGGGPQQGFKAQGYQVPQALFYGKPAPPGPSQSPPQPDNQSQPRERERERAQSQSQPQSQHEPQPQPIQPQSDTIMPPRRSAAGSGSQQSATIAPSPVKTKFPTARIKRIMQADEEVGKVAQQTPIAVGKALEMFMIALVTKSAEVAKEKNSKRVTAPMLKQVVESDEQWDFLREIVSKVDADDKKGGRSRAAKNESDDTESEEEPVEKKKRGGRKKKV